MDFLLAPLTSPMFYVGVAVSGVLSAYLPIIPAKIREGVNKAKNAI